MLDAAVTKFFVQNRIPFQVVESATFAKLVKALRPAYAAQLPSRRQLFFDSNRHWLASLPSWYPDGRIDTTSVYTSSVYSRG